MQRVAHDSKTISTATKYNCMSQHLPKAKKKTFVEEAFHDIFALWGLCEETN
jgi:nitrate reductase cytochrome c-type subunit